MFHPRRTWPEISAEGGDEASIWRSYLIFLAVISAVAGFAGALLIGGGVRVHMPLATVLVQGVANGSTAWLVSDVLALVPNLAARELLGGLIMIG